MSRGGRQEYFDAESKALAKATSGRPKSSIAEMIANSNKIQLNQTQPRLETHESNTNAWHDLENEELRDSQLLRLREYAEDSLG